MPIRKYDADTLGREYAAARRQAGGVLTQEEFFRSKGIPENYGCRKFGQVLKSYWAKSVAKAADEFTRRNGVNLARELGELFSKNKELVGRAYAKLIPKEGEAVEPKDFDEVLAMLHEGGVGMREIIKILSGGLPVQPPKVVDPVFRWHEPIEQSSKKKSKKPRAR